MSAVASKKLVGDGKVVLADGWRNVNTNGRVVSTMANR